MKKIVIVVTILVVAWTIKNKNRDVRHPDEHGTSEVEAAAWHVPPPTVQNPKVEAPTPANVSLREKIQQIETQIHDYENVLKSENAIDRLNHNELSDDQRARYFTIIKQLVSLRIEITNLKIEELEREG